ncbi:alpha/beta fold hydrolase [Natronomonas salsuginis]|uniref:Alpha/beta hydrolase n=1 Tax=Natronomonas salsuginis TaxID=2217661 RepID=A0A4U5JD62_9EURY|nr:alpha/beta hydrolase [Natronomonas salsuginis]TKR26211.1 alpha/beta hydrolase [Natronomonas salsuginis]
MSDHEPGAIRDHGTEEPIEGGYVWIDVDDCPHRIYYERAGSGERPLVCLHTAGADSRQWRHVLNDPEILDRFTVYAFDLPWHGRSFPPMDERTDWRDDAYRLTTEAYADHIVSVVETLDIEEPEPAVLGCSMGGAIVLELAHAHANRFCGVVGVESTAFAPKRDLGYLGDPSINAEVVRGEWAEGLQAPNSPDRFKRESWWVYAQGGPGVYTGDLYFYATDWDGREKITEIDTDACSVHLLTGEYDYSALPEDTRSVAEEIDGATVEIMDGLGHFPMVENPSAFREYLLPALESVAAE